MYKKALLQLRKSKSLNFNEIAQSSIGLSFAEIHRICDDITKDFIVYGSDDVTEEKILYYAETRKQPF